MDEMMRLIYGTGNPAKLLHMREMLSPLPLEIVGIASVTDRLPAIDESGNDPLQNAVIKAEAYFEQLHLSVFSCDSGLYIEGLDDARQPGVHVRTIGGKRLTDDEMVAYYTAIAEEMGGSCRAAYHNAICLKYDETHSYRYMGDDLKSEPFLLTARLHPKRVEGFPLDGLSVDLGTGLYYYDLDTVRPSGMAPGFRRFFQSALRDLGLPLGTS